MNIMCIPSPLPVHERGVWLCLFNVFLSGNKPFQGGQMHSLALAHGKKRERGKEV